MFSLQHFIAPALDLLPCLQARGTRDCNKCSKSLQVLLKNVQVLLESDIILLVGKHSVLGK